MCNKLINHDIEDESMREMCDTSNTFQRNVCSAKDIWHNYFCKPSYVIRRAGGSAEHPNNAFSAVRAAALALKDSQEISFCVYMHVTH